MKRIITGILLSALLGGLTSCTQQSLQATYDKQTTYIESFLSTNMKADPKATLVLNGGSYRLTLDDVLNQDRDSLDYGGKVNLYYALYTLTNSSISKSNLISTNKSEVAAAAGWDLTDKSQFQISSITLDGSLVEGLRLGLHGVQSGDEAYILFNGKYGYGDSPRGAIPANSALAYHVWIDSIEQ